MDSESSQISFQMLPCEMKLKIFNYISFEDKKSGCLVSRQWWNILSWHESMYYRIFLNDQTLKYVQLCTKQDVDEIVVGNLSSTALAISRSRTNSLPTQARVLTLHPGISESNMDKILRYYCSSAQVQDLQFTAGSLARTGFGRVAYRNAQTWSSLRSLRLDIIPAHCEEVLTRGSPFNNHSQAVAEFLNKAKIPQLRKLQVMLDYGHVRNFMAGETHPFEEVYISLFGFLIRHAEGVKELELHLKGNSVSSFNTNYQFGHPTGLGAVKLEKFVLHVNIDEVGPYLVHLLNSQSNVKQFDLNCQYWFIPADLNDVLLEDFLVRNAPSLQDVNLFGIVHNVRWLHNYGVSDGDGGGMIESGKAGQLQLQSLSLVLINTNYLVRLFSHEAEPPRHYHTHTPSLAHLIKFSLVSYFGTPNVTNPHARHEQILSWIIVHMPNLEELDLAFRCLYVFTPGDVDMLVYGLKKLKTLGVYEPDVAALREYCVRTPGISGDFVLRETDHKEYLYQMQIDRKAWDR